MPSAQELPGWLGNESYESSEFFINPADYGLPTRDELVAYRIWDNHFHGFLSSNPIEQYERNQFFVERMGIERSISQEIGGMLEEPFAATRMISAQTERLDFRPPFLYGVKAFQLSMCLAIFSAVCPVPRTGTKFWKIKPLEFSLTEKPTGWASTRRPG